MGLPIPRRSEWIAAALTGVSVAFFLWPVTSCAVVVAAASAVILLAARQLPLLCIAGLALVQLSYPLLGVPSENPAALAPAVLAIYTLGRHSKKPRSSLIAAALFILVLTFSVGFSLADLLFATLVLGGTFLFGRMVGRRAVSARAARAGAAVSGRHRRGRAHGAVGGR